MHKSCTCGRRAASPCRARRCHHQPSGCHSAASRRTECTLGQAIAQAARKVEGAWVCFFMAAPQTQTSRPVGSRLNRNVCAVRDRRRLPPHSRRAQSPSVRRGPKCRSQQVFRRLPARIFRPRQPIVSIFNPERNHRHQTGASTDDRNPAGPRESRLLPTDPPCFGSTVANGERRRTLRNRGAAKSGVLARVATFGFRRDGRDRLNVAVGKRQRRALLIGPQVSPNFWMFPSGSSAKPRPQVLFSHAHGSKQKRCRRTFRRRNGSQIFCRSFHRWCRSLGAQCVGFARTTHQVVFRRKALFQVFPCALLAVPISFFRAVGDGVVDRHFFGCRDRRWHNRRRRHRKRLALGRVDQMHRRFEVFRSQLNHFFRRTARQVSPV